MIPGEYYESEPIDCNGGYEAISLEVKMGDRAAQVGFTTIFMKQTKLVPNLIVKRREANVQIFQSRYSHCFEPGETKTVQLIDFGVETSYFWFQ